MKKKIPIITWQDQIKKYDNQLVVIKGLYAELNVSQKTTRISYVGRVKIVLNDNSFIILETDEKGIRSPEEISRFKDKQVMVTGTLHAQTYAWGDGSQATIVGPCILNIQTIRQS